jgi:hypothetical protein
MTKVQNGTSQKIVRQLTKATVKPEPACAMCIMIMDIYHLHLRRNYGLEWVGIVVILTRYADGDEENAGHGQYFSSPKRRHEQDTLLANLGLMYISDFK